MSLQSVVNNVINSLIRSGEFSKRIDLVKSLLAMLYLYNNTPQDFETILKSGDIGRFRELFHSNQNLRKVNVNLFSEYSGLKLLMSAIGYLLPYFNSYKKELVDAIISTITVEILGMHEGLYTEPNEVADLIAYLAKYIGAESVYDPFAGVASFATSSEFNGITFRGAEINNNSADIANLRLALNGQPMLIERMDSLRKWNNIPIDDALITIPPYGISLRDYDFYLSPNNKRSEDFILEQIIERDDICKAILLLPLHSFATSYKNEASRKYLVQTGILEMVISLPSSLLYGTSIPTAIVVVNKDRSEEDRETVTFLSLIDCVESDARGRNWLNVIQAKDRITSKQGKYAVTVSWSDIVTHHNSNLNPGEYLLENILPGKQDGAYFSSLSHLLIEKKPSIPTLGNKKTVIGLKDLEEEYSFTKEGTKPTSVISSRYYEVTEPTILVGLSSNSLKFGIAYAIDEPLYVSAEIAPLKIDDLWFNPEYLMLEFAKSYVQDQIKLLGYDRSFGKIDTILQVIKISCPSKDVQEELVNKAKDNILAKYQHVISASQRDFREDIHMKRHAMGQTIQAVGNWWKVLETVRLNESCINVDAVIDEDNLTLGEVLDNIKSCIARVKVQIDKLDRGYNAIPVKIDLVTFVEAYQSSHKSPIFHYSKLDYEKEIDEETQDRFQYNILFPKEVLNMILNNIVSNACSHGFGNVVSKANIIKMSIENIGEGYVLSISNNGKPCPLDMTPANMIKYGESSDLQHHCGIGAYEVNQLLRDFGGTLEIILIPNGEYPVEYRLTFKSFDK